LSTSQNYFETARDALISEQDKNSLLQAELDATKITISDLKSNEYELVYIGDYKLTHYCTEKRSHICGTGAGITVTGTQVTAGRTIAVDPSVIPYGTEVYIEGYGWRVAEDCGGAVSGKHIDIAVETHSQALSMGTTTGGVWILVKKGY
jgi:3D (Asp-Asp-Asp) domain-containing protein